MKQEDIFFNYKGQYFKEGNTGFGTRNLIFVFHGYGQLAKYFIKKFSILRSDQNCIVAPEGLSRFYLEGFYGRVGATWMTREERETDIENYISYLTRIYSTEINNCPEETKVHLIAFSQGAATATRFALSDNITIHSLNLWAGIFPPDLDFDCAGKKLSKIPVTVQLGTNDPFINDERIQEMEDLVNKLEIQPDISWYEGDHNIHDKPLRELSNKLGIS